jgi:Flp pilus assembly protein TadG
VKKQGQRGATIAEAALTVVALFTLLLGTVEFGRIFSIYQSVTNAAREGARYAVAPDPATGTLPSSAEVLAHVTVFLDAASLKGPVSDCADSGRDKTLPCVQVNPVATQVVNNVTVTYTQVTVVSPYTFYFVPFSPVNITAYSEMRNETN